MLNFSKKLSMMPRGLKYKTMIAFSLMSLIPLMIAVWLVTTYIFPNANLLFNLSVSNISLILVIALIISLLGLYLTRQMIDPVVRIAGDAKSIAGGDVNRVIDVRTEDEIGEIGNSLNIMTQKIRENIEQLKAYGEQTKLINMEINKKMIALSGLLQIGNLISSYTDLASILDFIAQKLSDLEEGNTSLIILLDEASGRFKPISGANINDERLRKISLDQKEVPSQVTVVDKDNPAPQDAAVLLMASGLKNMVTLPIIVSRKQYGILAVGNIKEGFEFNEDEKELLKVFAKQAAIAVENDILIKRAKELAIKDEITGLYNERYIHTRLDEEIKRACMYQRPCGYLVIDIDNFKSIYEKLGGGRQDVLLKAAAEILKSCVTEVDKVGRLSDDIFAVILPERNKKQSANIAEDIRKRIEQSLSKAIRSALTITVSVGVSENPIDGSTADELMEKAQRLVKTAKSLGKNRVAV